MLKWLTYSGFCVILTFNPLHWRLLPKAYKQVNEWKGPNE